MSLLSTHRRLDPVNALQRLQQELDRAFDRPTADIGLSGRGVFPPVNVFSDEHTTVLRFEVPGVSPDAIAVEVQGRSLKVSGKREADEPSAGSYHRKERWEGEFARSFQLSDDLDSSKAEAECKHGLLTIRIPKRDEARPRQIAVQG
jgi:HSP20 family protein